MKILLLGGSSFLGRAFASEALARGHQVTTFNRGRSGTDLPGVRAVRGERGSADELAALVEGRHWDAVVDTSAQQPEEAALSARLLSGHVDHYTLVSSVHAFSGWGPQVVDEGSPLHPWSPDTPPEEVPYNALKAGCELAVLERFGERSTILNSGLLIGPHEIGGRLPWWLERMARGGPVLAPGDRGRTMQPIDTRDFAAFGLDLLTAGRSGRYVTTAPPGHTTFGEFLDACVRATGGGAELVWVDEAPLLAEGPDQVQPWSELPLWAPDLPECAAVWLADSSRAQAAGLRCRPVADTARDTWAWLRERGLGVDTDELGRKGREGGTRLGIAPEKERRLLAAHSGGGG